MERRDILSAQKKKTISPEEREGESAIGSSDEKTQGGKTRP